MTSQICTHPPIPTVDGHASVASPAVHDALVDFAAHGSEAGALLIRHLPIGTVPATPPTPRTRVDKDQLSEHTLLTAARLLGEPVGYLPEHGGDLVQNLVPVAASASHQISTSSAVDLEFHTEAAFHPHRPRFLLLLCLRADPFGEARTLLSSIRPALQHLDADTRRVLSQRRFQTSPDESYTDGRPAQPGPPTAVLQGNGERPDLTFDAELMVGLDDEASTALATLRHELRGGHIGVALEAGDLLVIDNATSVHGRSSFRARYDGTDRWLQRAFVVRDLEASAGERRGRIITTTFA